MASGDIPFQISSTPIKPSIPKACTPSPEMLPPHRATLTVSPMLRLSRALLVVRTLAYVALFMPITQPALLMQAPMRKEIPLLRSTNREKIAATITTTENRPKSVFMNVLRRIG